MFVRYLLERRELYESSLRSSAVFAERTPLKQDLLLSCIEHLRQTLGPRVASVPECLTSSYGVGKCLHSKHERPSRVAPRKIELRVFAERSAGQRLIEDFLSKQRIDAFHQSIIGFHDRWC